MRGACLSGLGVSLPERELSSAELESRLGLSPNWISERTGIQSRRIASKRDTASSLGAAAANDALTAAGVKAGDLDLIICATVTPDWRFPATACLIQSALGARGAAFDLNAGCSGFLYGLAQADAAIRSGAVHRVLLVGCEVLSRITDHADPATAILFGDGAGAAVLEGCEDESRLGPFALFSDGSRPELLYVRSDTGHIHMRGREVYRAAVEGMATSVSDLLSSCRIDPSEVDALVAHQANGRILSAVATRLGISDDKVVTDIVRCGNTSAASIPLALHEAERTGALKEDDLVVLTAFGAGFTWGAGLVRWGGAGLSERRGLVGAGEARG